MRLVLTSERLKLTPVATADVDLAIEMFTDPAVTRFIGGVMSEEDIRREMPIWTKRGGDGCIGIWCVANAASGEKLGSSCLLPIAMQEDDTDWDLVVPGVMPERDVEVGYFLKRSAWGKGYATEVCRRLLRFAFEETPLQEVVATFEDGNEASQRVLSKAGLTSRGRRIAYGQDLPDWRISRAEWAASLAPDGGAPPGRLP